MIHDYYTVARIAVKKVRIWDSQKDDATQYVVMKLWENNLPEHVPFKKLITYACNKARDYLREVNGRDSQKDISKETMLLNEHQAFFNHNPTDTMEKYIDLQKTMSPMLEELIVKGTTMKEYGKTIGVNESRVSQLVSEEVTKLKKKMK